MTEQTKPQHLIPWCCPRCGADCSGTQDQFKESGDAIGYFLTCECGCEFIHWEEETRTAYGVEVDGQTYEYPEDGAAVTPTPITVDYDLLAEQISTLEDAIASLDADSPYQRVDRIQSPILIENLEALLALLEAIRSQRTFPQNKEPQDDIGNASLVETKEALMLTDQQKQAYVKNPTKCPYCGSNDIEGEVTENDCDGNYRQRITCHACGKWWVDVFTLATIEEPKEGESDA
jgi:hypothetical protein